MLEVVPGPYDCEAFFTESDCLGLRIIKTGSTSKGKDEPRGIGEWWRSLG